MQPAAARRTSRAPALFAGLLDDAAIFPPGNAPMAQAMDAFSAGQAGPAQPYVGAFLCSAPRLVELRSVLHPDAQLDLGLVVPGGVEALPAALQTVAADPRLRLKAVELPAGDAGVPLTLDALDDMLEQGVPAYVEVPLDSYVPDAAAVVRAAGRRLKMRIGGTTAAAFPTSAQLAAGLITCAAEQLAFKLTAGLHHAVRYRDSATGFEHHGFLNVLAAVANAADGGQAAHVADLLEERDIAALAQWAATLDDGTAARIRALFVGFGTCSTRDPMDDLVALGLLPEVSA
ncbi:MAG: hypothetical protein M3P91_06990 [Actinomycetota bacterium]|nr:hypothetical protein [Actinomycetota bacterium]